MTSDVSEKDPESRNKGFGVAASPFNGVKLELGISLILGVLLWLGAEFITADVGVQLLLLLSYGVLAAAWLVWRTRAVMRRCDAGDSGP
ncbi:MAG TPA: hypothetical protein ENI97_14020 [Gammaproteobacteria bacterium]|nr:hypothetical protein [Gammaproteobacteria bacterium]